VPGASEGDVVRIAVSEGAVLQDVSEASAA
jgi:hypothetical protein